jgi:hypothetical protein
LDRSVKPMLWEKVESRVPDTRHCLSVRVVKGETIGSGTA